MNLATTTIEELSLSAWPALQTMVYDGWILRFAEGYTKRSNSVNPLYASTIGLEEKIEACEGLYRSRGLPTIFKMVDCEEEADIDAALEARGYPRLDETGVRVLDLEGLEAAPRGELEIDGDFSPGWIEGFCRCNRNRVDSGLVARLLRKVPAERIVVAKEIDGGIVGCGFGVVESGYVGLFDIIVDEDMRGRGFGEEIVRSILGRARAMGAGRAYLQVVVGKARAERLYEKLGFRQAYRYWYRKK